MRVGDLKQLLSTVKDDSLLVVVKAPDHSYRPATAGVVDAFCTDKNRQRIAEFWECDEDGNTNIQVFLVE